MEGGGRKKPLLCADSWDSAMKVSRQGGVHNVV